MNTYIVKEDGYPYPITINIFTTNDKEEAIKVMREKYGRWTVVYENNVPIGAMK